MSRSRHRAGALVLAAALVGAACGSGDDAGPVATNPGSVSSDTPAGATPTDPDTTDDDTTGPPADTTGATADRAVPELLQFTAPLVGGGEFDGAAVAGTTTLFWFWAPF